MKFVALETAISPPGSAPTRGPWIEISTGERSHAKRHVGPHTGAVD